MASPSALLVLISIITTSPARPFTAMVYAMVLPTLPAPIMVTFLLMVLSPLLLNTVGMDLKAP